MIAMIRGKLVDAGMLTDIIIDVNGVGYLVAIPLSTYDKLPPPGGEIELLIHTQVREDAIQLYGFATIDEKQLFSRLVSVSGIGPKLALNVLSCMTVTAFSAAIADADIKVLSRISGVGRKSAERLVVELRDKLTGIGATARNAGDDKFSDAENAAIIDAVSALEALGFKREKTQKIIAELAAEMPGKERNSENLIRQTLRKLNS